MKKLLLALVLSASYITVNAQVGHLDSTFGTNGLAQIDFGISIPFSMGRDVLLHPDGSFYVFSITNGKGYVAHFMSNGALDLSYGKGGYSVPVPVMESIEARAVIQSDGKIVIGAYTINNGNADFLIVRLNTDGFFDNSFSGDGKQITDFDSTDNRIYTLALQGDGKILALGTGLARYNPDGSLDNSFSGDGKLPGAGGISIAIQSDGKILTASGASVFRYLADGTQDIGFGSGGSVSFSFISPVASVRAVAVQNDGKIVVGGIGGTALTREDFLVARLNSNGSFDNSFSGDGVQTTNFGGIRDEYGEVLAIQNDGKILLAGRSHLDSFDVALARYNTDGSLDNSFSADGILISPIMGFSSATSIVLQPDSKILVAGFLAGGQAMYYFVERFDSNGNLDLALDADGMLIGFTPGTVTPIYNSSVVQTDGKIIAAGVIPLPEQQKIVFAIARYNKDGSFDSSFSQDGRQTLAFQSGSARINAIALQADGKILAAGPVVTFDQYGTNSDFAIVRFNVDGTLDSSFSDDGITLTDFDRQDELYSIALQTDGKIVVAGDVSAGMRDFALARFNPDGTLDNSFSDDGKLVVDIDSVLQTPSADFARSVLIQPDGKIVVVGQSGSGLAIVRLNPNGSFDPLFDGDGILIKHIDGSYWANALAAALQGDGRIIVAGGISFLATGNDFLVVRLNTDGSFDNSFSDDGILAFNLGSTSEGAQSIALQTDGKILVGGSFSSINTIDFGLIRLNQDGTIDSSFSDDGISTPEFPDGVDNILSLSISGNRVYAAGITSFGNLYGGVAAFRIFDEPSAPLTVTIPDAYALYDGVEANTVYKGYEPASKLTMVAENSGGTAPYTYKWSNGATTATIKVGPSNTKTYSVTVTDALGNKSTASKMVKVVDIRCGYKQEKVLICHKGHEGSHRSVTLCISADAVESHLRHGDNLGSCRQSDESDFLTISAHPNPSRHSFDLRIKSDETVLAELIVWNILGKIIERKTVYTNSTVRIGAWYRPGIYLAEVKYKNKRAKTKLIKLSH